MRMLKAIDKFIDKIFWKPLGKVMNETKLFWDEKSEPSLGGVRENFPNGKGYKR